MIAEFKNVNCKNTVITGVIVVVNCNTWKCLSCKRRNNSRKVGDMYTIRENMIYYISVKEVSFLSNVFWFINAYIIPTPHYDVLKGYPRKTEVNLWFRLSTTTWMIWYFAYSSGDKKAHDKMLLTALTTILA